MTNIPILADLVAQGKPIDILFWVGCAGSFDTRYRKVTRAFAKILNHLNINFAVLGKEESCTGDPARRAGNEFLFQVQAISNIEILNAYEIKTIITTCPHCFHTLKNEYPSLGGNYEVIHHTTFLEQLLNEGRLKLKTHEHGETMTYHDSCYMGRYNRVYQAPRHLLKALKNDLIEIESNKKQGLCCGAGGGQMFKDAEKGKKEINIERVEQAIKTKTSTIAVNCPFCMTMLSDGIKFKNKEDKIKILDLAELLAKSLD